jgi:hypothetical protein
MNFVLNGFERPNSVPQNVLVPNLLMQKFFGIRFTDSVSLKQRHHGSYFDFSSSRKFCVENE